MRVLDRIISFLFSIIMLMVSILLILVGARMVEPQMIMDFLANTVFNKQIIAQGIANPITIAGFVLLLLSLKTTVCMSLFKVPAKAPISVKTKDGVVQIAPETIINTARATTMMYESVKDCHVSVIRKGKGVIVREDLQIFADTTVKELTEQIQKEVKEKVSTTTGIYVYDVDIQIKNIIKGSRPAPAEQGVVYDKITGRPKVVGGEQPTVEETGVSELKVVEPEVKSENVVTNESNVVAENNEMPKEN